MSLPSQSTNDSIRLDDRQLDRIERGVMSLQEGEEVVKAIRRLLDIANTARVFVREFDHLIGNEKYPERQALKAALRDRYDTP